MVWRYKPGQAVEDMSPFQGFQRGWWDIDWAFGVLTMLPADVLEGEIWAIPVKGYRLDRAIRASGNLVGMCELLHTNWPPKPVCSSCDHVC